MGNKKLITEIDRYKELMGLSSLNERYEDLPTIQDTYSNITFANRTKNDRLPKNLLDDIQSAADYAGITAQIDWAKTGHRKVSKSGNISRHWYGWAVDISHIDGKGWSSKSSAKKQGILDGIEKFVSYLKSKGYSINSEIGNDKSVLYFGFSGHDDHLHVSNKSGQPSPTVDDNDVELVNQDVDSPDEDLADVKTDGDKFVDDTSPWDVEGGFKKRIDKIGDNITKAIKTLGSIT